MKPDGKRLTWAQIVKKYPHQTVGLVDVEYGENDATVASAIVKCTSKDTDPNEIFRAALRGELLMEYTTFDIDFPLAGAI